MSKKLRGTKLFLFFSHKGIAIFLKTGIIKLKVGKSGERWCRGVLIGEYNSTLDVKGRFSFPSKLREDLGESFVITKGLDECLFVYSLDEWKRLEEKIKELPMSKARSVQRFLFASAMEVQADKQGRVLVSQGLRDFAHIEKNITVIGASNRAEIWDKDRWEQSVSDLTSDSLSEIMDELGF